MNAKLCTLYSTEDIYNHFFSGNLGLKISKILIYIQVVLITKDIISPFNQEP